jgi:ribosomal-protein-alanine N-acetyltransferase
MSAPTTAVRPDITVRWMVQRDLPCLLRLENQLSHSRWTADDFQRTFETFDTVGRVAEIGEQVVGFIVYRVSQEPDIIDTESVNRYLGPHRKSRPRDARPVRMEILNLVVSPIYRRQGVARTLLQTIGRRLQQSGGMVRVVVPETCLACQLLLRSAGYRATRLLRDHFGNEDGYVMERRD